MNEIDDKLLDLDEVANLLSVSKSTLRRWTREKQIPFTTTLGGHRRFRLSEIKKLIDENPN